jgi:hypothetical protein
MASCVKVSEIAVGGNGQRIGILSLVIWTTRFYNGREVPSGSAAREPISEKEE